MKTPEICRTTGISRWTLQRWYMKYVRMGADGLLPASRRPRRSSRRTPAQLENRILRAKKRHPSWGAKRIQAVLVKRGTAVHWITVHRILKRSGLVAHPARKHKTSNRFQRTCMDSLWQFDVYEFRAQGLGRVCVFDILDDRSRYLVASRAYKKMGAQEATDCLHWALAGGRHPDEIYVDNAKCFRAASFKKFCESRRIRIIYGTPYNPRGRGKLERFHRTLHDELISRLRTDMMSHVRKQLRIFRHNYNEKRLHGAIGWITPSEIYYGRVAGDMPQTGLQDMCTKPIIGRRSGHRQNAACRRPGGARNGNGAKTGIEVQLRRMRGAKNEIS